MGGSIEEARRRYAEELRFTAKLGSRAVVEAFATVPREHFFGPGPWRVLSPMAMPEYWTTEDADPRHLYHDVLIAIEIDPILAARAKDNLAAAWPQATVVTADGFLFQPDRLADAVVVNAGVTHLSSVWLDALAAENGRLLVPLTNADRWGGFLMITRQAGDPHCSAARFVGRVGIIPCVGGRDPAAEERLTAALARSDFTAIRSLRRPPDAPDETCWLAGEGWWLSTAPASSG
jgi:protein-L-isoaspartate(D-aspartate) O-methyltransferase